MSMEVLKNISDSLKNSDGRKIQRAKASGGQRLLTIALPRDKSVKEAMRMILEAVFEPAFCSHWVQTQLLYGS